MKEILFRGKRIDNGEWIQGYLALLGDDYYIAPDINAYTSMGGRGKGRCMLFGHYYQVLPETVGQYTGLTDKNCKKIFEGDIVEYPIESGGHKGENIHEVVFENRHGTAYFGIKMSNIETWGFDMEVPSKLMKVIGNIHDNPELLEVKK